MDDEQFVSDRMRMVDNQLARRGIRDTAVLNAMRVVPRHRFVPERYLSESYDDGPLPIGEGQTISQPYVVASMTEHLELDSDSTVLEIGTGSGYQTAILAEIVRNVYTIEVVSELARRAAKILKELGYTDVATRVGDGSAGWPEAAPFDGIIVTAAAPRIPQRLVDQLRVGGRMVLPLSGESHYHQDLIKIKKTTTGIERENLYEVRFVPMIGEIDKS